MKVAIVHYWLTGMRGGEKVLEALCDLFPNAVIITHVIDRNKISEKILQHEIRTTFISKLPLSKKHYQKYLPLMPYALESMDMQEFDLVISSESGPAKGVITRPDAVHVCYCHSPMRYIWDHYHIYRKRSGMLTQAIMPYLSHKLRMWDAISANRVDKFIANSNFISKRIESYYRRESSVIFPPVDIDSFAPHESKISEDHYLLAGELVSYKRPDIAIKAFNESGRHLRIIGDGPEFKYLKSIANNNITFLGKVAFEDLKNEFASAKALIFPGEEDFGIIPVEAIASGTPVLAYGRGGALDTVVPETGLLFKEQSPESLNDCIDLFETQPLNRFCRVTMLEQAQRYSVSRFKSEISEAISNAIQEKGKK